MPSLSRTLTLFSLKQLKHAAIIDQGKWENVNNTMKGIWYLERNLSLFWKGSQMSKYIAFEFQCETSSWTLLEGPNMCSQSVSQICDTNLSHKCCLHGQVWFYFIFFTKQRSTFRSISQITVQCFWLNYLTMCIKRICCLSLSNMWTNSFDPNTTMKTCHHFDIWHLVIYCFLGHTGRIWQYKRLKRETLAYVICTTDVQPRKSMQFHLLQWNLSET